MCMVEEALFFAGAPGLLPLYEQLRAALLQRYPDSVIRVQKTQISFCDPRPFCLVSLPRRAMGPGPCCIVTFGLGSRLVHERIVQAVEPYPGRWTHHVPIFRPEDVDDALLDWIEQAYGFKRLVCRP